MFIASGEVAADRNVYSKYNAENNYPYKLYKSAIYRRYADVRKSVVYVA
jgi:hypothetical protein